MHVVEVWYFRAIKWGCDCTRVAACDCPLTVLSIKITGHTLETLLSSWFGDIAFLSQSDQLESAVYLEGL